MAPKFPTVCGYKLVDELGYGSFGTVYRAVDLDQGRVAACKHVLITKDTPPSTRKSIEKEIKIHGALKHENILEFISAAVMEIMTPQKYHPGWYMLLELAAGGDLFDKIQPDVGVGEEVAQLFFKQLAAGIEFMHGQGVCHRDLKPENLLLDAAGTLKISDFGLAAVYKLKDTGQTRALSERCGSLPYAAPELVGDQPYQAEPVDIWGIGVILFALLAGNTPWDEASGRSAEFVRYVKKQIFSDEPWCRFSDDALSLVRGLLHPNPSKRFTLMDAARHPWCMRPSQLANAGVIELAERLTDGLRMGGDLDVAAPNIGAQDGDGDATMGSPFTQTLLLFSQTQTGTRHVPHLTRFYTSLGPTLLLPILTESLEALGCKVKDRTTTQAGEIKLRLRVGGFDRRKVLFKGWIEVEGFELLGEYGDVVFSGSFCLMRREEGNPMSWRQLWKTLILSPAVEPHVCRKHAPTQQ